MLKLTDALDEADEFRVLCAPAQPAMRVAFFVNNHAMGVCMVQSSRAVALNHTSVGDDPSRAPWRALGRAHVSSQALQRVDVAVPLMDDPAHDPVAMHRDVHAAGLRSAATPRASLQKSHWFWLRAFATAWVIYVAVIEQLRCIAKRLPTTTVELSVVATVVAASAVLIGVVQAHYIGFPVPFSLVLGTPGSISVLAACIAARWGKYIQQHVDVQRELRHVHIRVHGAFVIGLDPVYAAAAALENLNQALDRPENVADPSMMPLPAAKEKEWMVLVEKQQREIEELRYALASAAGDMPHSMSSRSSIMTSQAPLSSPLSDDAFAFPLTDKDALLSMDQYQKMCEKMQRVRQKLTKRDVTIRNARAQITATRTEIERYRQENAQLQIRVQQSATDLEREVAVKDEAIEKAAHARIQCEALGEDLELSKQEALSLRTELQVQKVKLVELEGSRDKLQLENAELQVRIMQLSAGKDERKQTTQESVPIEENTELRTRNLAFKHRVAELESVIQVQTSHIERQQQALTALGASRAQLERDLQHQRDESKAHAAHLLQTNISLQHHLDNVLAHEQMQKQRATESTERSHMLVEELELMSLREAHRKLQLKKYEDDCSVLFNAYKELKASRNMELSRRDLIASLRESKKRVLVLEEALATLDTEIQNISKVVTAARSREQSVGRVLREYSKRNKALQDAVGATKEQSNAPATAYPHAISIFVSSLLRQCDALEKCLAFYHASTSMTRERAHQLHVENSVLQTAVEQLCAYSHELVTSQQQLKHLEVTGKSEPITSAATNIYRIKNDWVSVLDRCALSTKHWDNRAMEQDLKEFWGNRHMILYGAIPASTIEGS
ncbi:hypothetical protein FI667_g5081, partial [Globisporangium splendens]